MSGFTTGEIIHGDSVDVLETLPDDHYHAIVTDPPYNLDCDFGTWDDIGSPREYQEWCREWSEKAMEVLKPGGHLIAFGGNRSHHRLMCGIEDAGYEIRDTITWHYGNGFPKGPKLETWLDGEDAEQWGDWRSMLKPATEFAVLARSPLGESSAARNQVAHGVGNLNIEHCRLPTSGISANTNRNGEQSSDNRYNEDGATNFAAKPGPRGGSDDGRYPPNIALDPIMADLMDLMSGGRPGCQSPANPDTSSKSIYRPDQGEYQNQGPIYPDTGGASRFFYCSKASASERSHNGEVDNDHPTVKPVDLMEWLIKLVTDEGQRVLDPFAGSGTTLIAAERAGRHCDGIEINESYIDIATERMGVGL